VPSLDFYIDLTSEYSYNIRMESSRQYQTGIFRPDHDPPPCRSFGTFPDLSLPPTQTLKV
jgi:hypothetical protein